MDRATSDTFPFNGYGTIVATQPRGTTHCGHPPWPPFLWPPIHCLYPLSPITDAFTPYSPRINGYYHQSLSTPRSLWPITPPYARSTLLTLRHSSHPTFPTPLTLHHHSRLFSRFHLPFSPIEIAGPSVSLVNHHHHTPIKWPEALQTPAAPVLYGSGSVEQTHPDAAVSTPEPPGPTIASKPARSTQKPASK